MTLTETFAKHTSQEFPPKYVFVYDMNQEPRTILVSEISEYEMGYKNSDMKFTEHANTGRELSKEWNVPTLDVK